MAKSAPRRPVSRDHAAVPEELLVHVESRDELREWLRTHAAASPTVWLVTWKRATGRPAPTYDEVVEEALCFGWIDSTARTIDDERSALRLSRRKPGSGWSRSNKIRLERLEREGRMTDAGRAVVERARADGSWELLDAVENLEVPADLAASLAAHPGATEQFDGFPRGEKRRLLEWVVQAKRPETRRKRVDEIAAAAERGERANQWIPKDKR
jgi:uncharacterized protein YdeI (YjbR/CyaY-like superfamily)